MVKVERSPTKEKIEAKNGVYLTIEPFESYSMDR